MARNYQATTHELHYSGPPGETRHPYGNPGPYGCPMYSSPVHQSAFRSPIHVDKWGLKFDGVTATMTAEDFIFRLETLQCQYACPWSEVLRDFHLLLKDSAYDWFWQFQRDCPRPDWPTLKDAFLRRYRNTRSDYEILREIMDRRQNSWENSEEFFGAINKMRFQLRVQIPEMEMVRILKRNLNERIGKLVYPQQIYSLDQLRTACMEAETAFPRREAPKAFRKPAPRYAANELEYGDPDFNSPDEQVAAYQFGSARPREPPRRYADASALVCWNCKVQGHTYFDCEAEVRNLFCYRCGLEGVKTPSCPKCHPGNASKSAKTLGSSRSGGPLNPQ